MDPKDQQTQAEQQPQPSQSKPTQGINLEQPKYVKVEDRTPKDPSGKPVLPMAKEVWIEIVNPNDGRTYAGLFAFKRLTIPQTSQLGADIARLGGGLQVDPATEFLNIMIAQCRLSVVKAPEWFVLDELYDLEPVTAVYKEVLKFEKSFHRAAR